MPALRQGLTQSLISSPPLQAPPALETLVSEADKPAPEDLTDLPVVPSPAKPLLRPATLEENCFILPGNLVFVDRILPIATTTLLECSEFPKEYFVALHKLVSAPSPYYSAFTPNYMGARVQLQHTKLRIDRWRYHLLGYEGSDIVQFLEYGFPIGLEGDKIPKLVPTLRNHGSAYQYFTYLDKFLSTGLSRCELAGPFNVPPFLAVHVSPLMTAIKKPSSRRSVFDATFGEVSLNSCTPQDTYLDQPFTYDFPKIEDFKRFIISCGQGSYLWKRDLSRYYLQLPVDPTEYPLLCFVWRQRMFFFCSLMFGLRHAGLQGQKVTTAVTWTHRRLGLETDDQTLFNSLNYSDDIGGCETTLDRATQSFDALGSLLCDLGLEESTSKAHPPSTSMPYLGIQFDTVLMRMSIPPDKLAEVRDEVSMWMKKSMATKKSLQQLLGKLFWVSRCIRFSRGFMGRLITQLQCMHAYPDNKRTKLSEGCRLDIKWWDRYLRRFNGVEILYPTDPLNLPLADLLETSALVNCGDAYPEGGGAYFGQEYWSRRFPDQLRDPAIPIHIKEFWVVIASAWLWGDSWRGSLVYVFCDNEAVVHVLDRERPRDPRMLELLQEYLYIVCTKGFTPIFKKVGTKDNTLADFLSRNHDESDIRTYLRSQGLPNLTRVQAPDHLFTLGSNW